MFQARKKTDLIVVHCSATPPSMDIGAAEIDRMHRQKGWLAIGYHWVIRRNGTVEAGRPVGTIGAHAEGHNSTSVGIVLVGGVGPDGKTAENNFTPAQFDALENKLREMRQTFPMATRIVGHGDLSPDLNHDGKITPNEWMKQCPSFSVAEFISKRGIR